MYLSKVGSGRLSAQLRACLADLEANDMDALQRSLANVVQAFTGGNPQAGLVIENAELRKDHALLRRKLGEANRALHAKPPTGARGSSQPLP